MAIRTSNPALSANVFMGAPRVSAADGLMTVNGAVQKTAILLAIAVLTAAFAWFQSMSATVPVGAEPMYAPTLWMPVGFIGGFVVAMVTIFKQDWAPVTAPLYAALEGLALGSVSALFEQAFPGIVFQAMTGTFGTLAALLLAYQSGLIRVTERFRMGLVAATGGIALVYLAGFVMNLFGAQMPMIHGNGLVGIGFSVVVVVVAALNLVLDFDFIEKGAQYGAPKYMEWYGAFGLMVTLVWLYLEILRLLAKLRGRD